MDRLARKEVGLDVAAARATMIAMADILSFSKARKTKARAAKDAAAVENRIKFGRTKAEKAADETRKRAAEKSIDGHKREP